VSFWWFQPIKARRLSVLMPLRTVGISGPNSGSDVAFVEMVAAESAMLESSFRGAQLEQVQSRVQVRTQQIAAREVVGTEVEGWPRIVEVITTNSCCAACCRKTRIEGEVKNWCELRSAVAFSAGGMILKH